MIENGTNFKNSRRKTPMHYIASGVNIRPTSDQIFDIIKILIDNCSNPIDYARSNERISQISNNKRQS